MKKYLFIVLLTMLMLSSKAVAGNLYGKTVFMGDVSVGNWTNGVIVLSAETATGGSFTNGVYTNYYRFSGTNVLGRIPARTNIICTFTGNTNTTNAVTLTWARYDGLASYVIERSQNTGSSWTNWISLPANSTNWTDLGTNAWTNSIFTNVYPNFVPAPTMPWIEASQTSGLGVAYAATAGVAGSATNATTVSGPQSNLIASALQSVTNHSQSWNTITSTPTSLSGYGVTNKLAYLDAENVFTTINTIDSLHSLKVALGSSLDLADIGNDATGGGSIQMGASPPMDHSMTIGANSPGVIQSGLGYAPMVIGDYNVAAAQHLYVAGGEGATIGQGSYGSQQRGYVSGSATISNSAAGAGQFGRVGRFGGATAVAVNSGIGAFQLLDIDNAQMATTSVDGAGSLLMGAGVSSNRYAIVAGDGQQSHGDGSVSASGGFWDNGIRVPTNATISSYVVTNGGSGFTVNGVLNMAGNSITNISTLSASNLVLNGTSAVFRAFLNNLTNNDVLRVSVSGGVTSLVSSVSLPTVNQISNVWVSTSGKIGIGTANPISNVELSGIDDNVAGLTLSYNSSYRSDFSIFSSGSPGLSYMSANVNSGSGTTRTNVLVLMGNGNVGIGQTSPVTKFHVAGDATLSNVWVYGSVSQTVATASNYFAGRVGIGTSTPQNKLHIIGSNGAVPNYPTHAQATNSSLIIENNGDRACISMIATGNANSGIWFFTNNAATVSAALVVNVAATNIGLVTAGVTRLLIDDAGRVGIGTTTGTNILTIVQNSATDPIADSWTTYTCNRDAKDIVEPNVIKNYADELAAVPVYRWKRKHIVRDEEVLQKLDRSAAIVVTNEKPEVVEEKVEEKVEEAIEDGETNSVPVAPKVEEKTLTIADFTPSVVEAKREQLATAKAALPKFTATHVGVMLDDPQIPKEICANGDPNSGIDLVAWCGYLQAALRDEIIARKALEARVKALEGK